MINLKNIKQHEMIQKPWGCEIWIQPGSESHPYVLKKITLLSGNRTSLQVHRVKAETIYILAGTGELTYSASPVDLTSLSRISDIVFSVDNLSPGTTIAIPAGVIHRLTATTDLEYIEASTTQLDDIIRLQDDTGRVTPLK